MRLLAFQPDPEREIKQLSGVIVDPCNSGNTRSLTPPLPRPHPPPTLIPEDKTLDFSPGFLGQQPYNSGRLASYVLFR